MERKIIGILKISVLIFILFASQTKLLAQDINQILYQSYITEKMDNWYDAMNGIEGFADEDLLYQKVIAQYGYIGYLFGINQKKEIREIIGSAQDNIDTLLSKNNQSAELIALKSAFMAFDMITHIYKIPIIGPKALSYINLAVQLDENEPMGWIMYASKEYYSPTMFGGSKQNAFDAYEKAIKLFEENNTALNNWQYLNSIAITGTWYYEQKQYEKAKEFYKKALNIEPEFSWVKKTLLPQVEEKLKGKVN